MNIQSYIDDFLTYIGSALGRSDNTVTSYAVDLAQFADYLETNGIADASDIDVHSLRGFLRDMSGYGFNRASIARKLSALRRFVGFLASRGVLKSDISVGLKGPKIQASLPRAIAAEDVVRMLTDGTAGNKKELRDTLILEILYGSGLRVSEVVQLNWDDVDVPERWFRVMGKGSKERLVPFSLRVQQLLGMWRTDIETRKVPADGTDPVFYGVGAERLTERTVHRIVTAAGKRVGLYGVHPHSLRHSFATHMLERGAPLIVIQQLLGHESLSATQRYLAITDEQMKKSYIEAHPRAKLDLKGDA